MFKRLHISFPLIVFFCLVLLTYWLDKATQPQSFMPDNLRHDPDYIVENLSGIRMDYQRDTRRTFLAEKMFYYREEDVTQLERTSFINTEPNAPLMRLFAEQAKLVGDAENIYLTGGVTVLRGADDDKNLLTLITNSLHLIPDDNLVKTDQFVTVSRLSTTVNAIGLMLDNNTGMVELLSQVKAVND